MKELIKIGIYFKMIKINKLRTELQTNLSNDIDDLYGFSFNFTEGLNIIAGPNSRGKSTINSCIYYALGMEELLGAHNDKALDKALKEEFEINISEDEKQTHHVIFSRVLLEIENSNQQRVTLERIIVSDTDKKKNSNIYVYNTDLEGYLSSEQPIEVDLFYVNQRGNNEDANGFYKWLAEFIGIELPMVSNSSRTDNYSPLYLQTIFSSLFIEQTKGWSEFLATMPYFGITKPKEKVVEYILNLNSLNNSTNKDILLKNKSQIIEKWDRKIRNIKYLSAQNNSILINIPDEITTLRSDINKINILFTKSETEKIEINQFLEEKSLQIRSFEGISLAKVGENKEELINAYREEKENYNSLKNHINNFRDKLNIEVQQRNNLEKYLIQIDKEIKDSLNLIKVFDEDIINKKNFNSCPTCTQEIPTDLISSKQIKIPQLSIEENTNFLKGQKSIVTISLKNLEESIEEKGILLNYYINTLRNKEEIIKKISNDLIADDRAFSESDALKRVQLENEYKIVSSIRDSFNEIKEELIEISNQYNDVLKDINDLSGEEERDKNILDDFENYYKDLLYAFKYDSNEKYKISINRKEPFKYFPVYKSYKDDKLPQSIRINSSASDFVRNIWAYSIALLGGENHPGILLFDEPGQHRTNLLSLKAMFEICSNIDFGQIIIFTSTERKLNDNEPMDVEYVVSKIPTEKYNLILLPETNKVIQSLN
ncbi:hypothetical protein [Chryseobacterium sp. Mn2064]|uniref:hypothetical protein n=1 Tax=Chryseobacterium sp. Mn2064 TaxID=3395263 RepID=UPI003BDE7BA9